MKRLWIYALALALAVPALAADKTGRDIVDDMVSGISQGNMLTQLDMVLIGKGGEKRLRSLRSRMKEVNDQGRSVVTFEAPEEVKGTKFLVIENKGRDDDQFLYLPALKKVRRIASSQRSGSFMGTDFSYYDLETHDVDEGDHTRLPDETIDGHVCYVVETVPKASAGSEYSKVRYWVRQDNKVVVKADIYDKNGAQVKALVADKMEQYKPGKWMPLHLKMTNVQKGTSTEITITKYKFDADISDDYFTERFLADDSQL